MPAARDPFRLVGVGMKTYVSRLGRRRPHHPPGDLTIRVGQRVAFGEPGRGLHPDHHLVVEFGDGRGADVGTRASHAGGDVVEQVLDPAARRVQPHPRRRDAFLEQRLAGPVERAVARGAGGHRAFGRHPVTLLERLVLTVAHQIARRLVGTREPRADHHVRRSRRQRQRHVAGMAHTSVGPHVAAELPCCRSTFDHRGELRPADAGHHPGGAHRAGSDPDLDDRRARGNQVAGGLRRHDVARGQRQPEAQRGHRLDRVEHLELVAVRGVDHQQVHAGLGERAGLGADIAVDAERGGDAQPALVVDGGGVDAGPDRPGAGQHAGQRAVRPGHHRDVHRRVLEQVEHRARVGARGGGDEIGHRDVADPGEPVDADAVGLGDQPDGAALEHHDRGAVCPLVDQGGGVRNRIVG